MDHFPIVKIRHDGKPAYKKDCGYMELVWDEHGKYVGQWQDNMLDEGVIFIPAHPRKKGQVASLTEAEMAGAHP